MPNQSLTNDELGLVNELLSEVRSRLVELSAGDPFLLFAYRRKVFKELSYDERGKPGVRAKLKALKWGQQGGRCAQCKEAIPVKYSELDRRRAIDGYTPENTELVCGKCHVDRQAAKKYAYVTSCNITALIPL
jgi:hypothetical protein